jgi:hypothetical protein
MGAPLDALWVPYFLLERLTLYVPALEREGRRLEEKRGY